MVKVALQIRATLDNVDELRTSYPDFTFYFKVKCTNCGEESDKWHDLNETDKFQEDNNSRTKGFSLYMKCKMCSRENSIDIIPESNGEWRMAWPRISSNFPNFSFLLGQRFWSLQVDCHP